MDTNASLSSLQTRVTQKLSGQKSTDTRFDVIVIGVGSMGAAACYHLAHRDVNVLGLEQNGLAHENGSHSGQSRIIRKAYFEHPDYVPLLESAYLNWSKIEEEAETQLVFKTGLLSLGEPDNELITGIRRSATTHQIDVRDLSDAEMNAQYPQFSVPATYEKMIEPTAGFVTPERAILAHVDQALERGAAIHTHEQMLSYRSTKDGIEVKTDKGSYQCKKMIMTTGAWTGELLQEFKPRLTVTRQVLAWVEPKQASMFELNHLPCWMVAQPDGKGLFYGFPSLPTTRFGQPGGMKLGYHYPGKVTYPSQVERSVAAEEIELLTSFLNSLLPEAGGAVLAAKTCLYTNTPDNHFIVDFLPEDGKIVVAAGFSGHGFKFASVMGEILADMSTEGRTSHPIEFLGLSRLK